MCDTIFFKGDRDAKKMPKDNGGNGKKWTTLRKHWTTLGKC
jgi:hypothetical protein